MTLVTGISLSACFALMLGSFCLGALAVCIYLMDENDD